MFLTCMACAERLVAPRRVGVERGLEVGPGALQVAGGGGFDCLAVVGQADVPQGVVCRLRSHGNRPSGARLRAAQSRHPAFETQREAAVGRKPCANAGMAMQTLAASDQSAGG